MDRYLRHIKNQEEKLNLEAMDGHTLEWFLQTYRVKLWMEHWVSPKSTRLFPIFNALNEDLREGYRNGN